MVQLKSVLYGSVSSKLTSFGKHININTKFILLTELFQIILGTIFTLITYLMADQPLEPVRIIQYSLICLTLALTTEGLGLAIGAACNITVKSKYYLKSIVRKKT